MLNLRRNFLLNLQFLKNTNLLLSHCFYGQTKPTGQNDNYIIRNTYSLIMRLENSLSAQVDGPFKDESTPSNSHQKGGGAFENSTI